MYYCQFCANGRLNGPHLTQTHTHTHSYKQAMCLCYSNIHPSMFKQPYTNNRTPPQKEHPPTVTDSQKR